MQNSANIISLDNLKSHVPSLFAQEAWKPSTSYGFIPTIDILTGLQKEGWHVVSARQSGSRIEGKENYTKHLVRLRRTDVPTVLGDTIPELVILNSHDKTSCYKIACGLFRLACLNGMIVSAGINTGFTVRHTKNAVADVIEASYRIINEWPQVTAKAAEWQAKQLSSESVLSYVNEALAIRWPKTENRPTEKELVRVRRYADNKPEFVSSLWGIFQRAQEGLIKGRTAYVHTDELNRTSIKYTRPVRDIRLDYKINKALWELTEKYSKV